MSQNGTRRLLYATFLILYLLHNDLWLWDDTRIILGLPAGLLYHVGFCIAAAVLMGLLVTYAWPRHLQESVRQESAARQSEEDVGGERA